MEVIATQKPRTRNSPPRRGVQAIMVLDMNRSWGWTCGFSHLKAIQLGTRSALVHANWPVAASDLLSSVPEHRSFILATFYRLCCTKLCTVYARLCRTIYRTWLYCSHSYIETYTRTWICLQLLVIKTIHVISRLCSDCCWATRAHC